MNQYWTTKVSCNAKNDRMKFGLNFMCCSYQLSRIQLFLVSLLSYFFVIFIEIAWIFPLRFYQFSSQNIATFINSLKILITCTVVQYLFMLFTLSMFDILRSLPLKNIQMFWNVTEKLNFWIFASKHWLNKYTFLQWNIIYCVYCY